MIKSKYLRYLAKFEQKVIVTDDSGEANEEFNHLTSKYVDIKPISVDSEDEQSTTYQISRLELSVRHSAFLAKNIKTGDRVIIDSKPYRIDTINDIFSRSKLSYLISLYE